MTCRVLRNRPAPNLIRTPIPKFNSSLRYSGTKSKRTLVIHNESSCLCLPSAINLPTGISTQPASTHTTFNHPTFHHATEHVVPSRGSTCFFEIYSPPLPLRLPMPARSPVTIAFFQRCNTHCFGHPTAIPSHVHRSNCTRQSGVISLPSVDAISMNNR